MAALVFQFEIAPSVHARRRFGLRISNGSLFAALSFTSYRADCC